MGTTIYDLTPKTEIFEVQGNVFNNYNLIPLTQTDSDALSNSIYKSSTSGFLTYKDSGGTARQLERQLKIILPAEKFNQIKYIQSASDWGTPSGGYVQLTGNTTYIIDTTASTMLLPFGLRLPSSTIASTGNVRIEGLRNVGLATVAPNTNLFDGGNSCSLHLTNIGISAPVSGGKIFNLDGYFPILAGSNVLPIIIFQNVSMASSVSIGTIKNCYGLVMDFYSVGFCQQGLTLDGYFNSISLSTGTITNNVGTFTALTFPSTFILLNRLGILDSTFNSGSGQTMLNISSTATIGNGTFIVDNTSFNGAGTYLTGLNASDNKLIIQSCVNITNTQISGAYSFTTPAGLPNTTATTGATNFVKALGTTYIIETPYRFTHSDNRLTYTGYETLNFDVVFSTTVSNSTANQTVTTVLAKNGVVVAQSQMPLLAKTQGESYNSAMPFSVSLLTNDYVEIWIKSTGGNPTLQYGALTINKSSG